MAQEQRARGLAGAETRNLGVFLELFLRLGQGILDQRRRDLDIQFDPARGGLFSHNIEARFVHNLIL